ncbi:hypothetical protein ACFCXR_30170 [Streptomyces noursei]
MPMFTSRAICAVWSRLCGL